MSDYLLCSKVCPLLAVWLLSSYSKPQSPHLQNGDKNTTKFIERLWLWQEIKFRSSVSRCAGTLSTALECPYFLPSVYAFSGPGLHLFTWGFLWSGGSLQLWESKEFMTKECFNNNDWRQMVCKYLNSLTLRHDN